MKSERISILLVEDNNLVAELLVTGLTRSTTPFAVHHVTRLSEALDTLGNERIAVIVSDLGLPDSDGLETLFALRRQAPNLPIVVLTGLASDEVALASLDHGAQDYLVKGAVTPDMLERSIRYALQRQQNAEMRSLLARLEAHEKLLARKNRRLAKHYRTAHHFVDNVSHDFRTPLTVIKEYVSLLRDGVLGQLDEEQCRMLDVVGDRADDLNNMVDDMLDVSKLESGLFGIWRRNCQVSETLHRARTTLERKAAVSGVNFSVEIDDELPEVFCDPEKVLRVIVNLVVNAIKFCHERGQVKLWAKVADDSPEVVIGVTDNGPGIDPENVSKLFRRFKQLTTSTRRSTKGFGLGLNIAHDLVALNFGELTVESEPNVGSTFKFTLPFAQPEVVMQRYLERLRRQRQGEPRLTLLSAHIDPSVEARAAEEMDVFLRGILRRRDLLFRRDRDSWLLVLSIDDLEVPRFLERTQELRLESNRNRPHGPLPKLMLHNQGSHRVCEPTAILNQVNELLEPQYVTLD